MGENTAIAWTDHTHNPWWGCTKVSPGCDRCYAETWARRWGVAWGPHAERRRIGETTRNLPLKWNRAAEKAGVRCRVFCASMADVFDNAVPTAWRDELWALTRVTPWLDWQLLTKRPQNIAKMLPADWGDGWPNVWLGTTCENQVEADRRIPHLLAVPARVRFLSCEPLLTEVDVSEHLWGLPGSESCAEWPRDEDCECGWKTRAENGRPAIHWVIAGGESGAGARPMDPAWARSIRDQCAAAGVPFFMKQLGGVRDKLHDPAGWPEDLRVQEFPV